MSDYPQYRHEAGAAIQEGEACGRGHILAVDDDPAVRQVIVNYHGDNDYRVTALPSGRELPAVMAREMVDLGVLDLRMPGEDGMEIARKLREAADIPLIMVTAVKEEADHQMGLDLAA